MKEDFLQFLWAQQLITQLQTTKGQAIKVIDPGKLNSNAGPDFLEAHLSFDNQISLAGSVEVHLRASDWYRHNHHQDPMYRQCILHVVGIFDYSHHLDPFGDMPCLEIADHYPAGVLKAYHQMLYRKQQLPCESTANQIHILHWNHFLEGWGVQRLESKYAQVLTILRQTRNEWEEVMYRSLCKAFGMNVNQVPFSELAIRLPFRIIRKHAYQLSEIEALLFGTSGLLPTASQDEYIRELIKNFSHLKAKYQLRPMKESAWKFLRMRPANFPSQRIAQLSALMASKPDLFSNIKNAVSLSEIQQLLKIEPSEYWRQHYHFQTDTATGILKPGPQFIRHVLINAVAPLLFAYGKKTHKQKNCDMSLTILEQCPAEENQVSRRFKKAGIIAQNALCSQGMIELFKSLCQFKQCLHCQIGRRILKTQAI